MAEHLDHLHYISDILSLNVQSLNDVIIDHLLNRLLIPLYVYSLTDQALDSDDVNIILAKNEILERVVDVVDRNGL